MDRLLFNWIVHTINNLLFLFWWRMKSGWRKKRENLQCFPPCCTKNNSIIYPPRNKSIFVLNTTLQLLRSTKAKEGILAMSVIAQRWSNWICSCSSRIFMAKNVIFKLFQLFLEYKPSPRLASSTTRELYYIIIITGTRICCRSGPPSEHCNLLQWNK